MGFFSSLFGGNKELTPEETAKQNEKKFDILKFDGIKAQRMGQIPYSIKCFTEALALKDDYNTRLYLANSYNAMQEFSLAYEQLEILARSEVADIDTFLLMARTADHLQNWQAMNDACQKAFLLDDKRSDVHYYFGKACHGLGDEISAIAMLTKAITLDEKNKEAYLLRGEVLESMQQFKEAEKDIDTLLTLDAEEETFLFKKGQLRIINDNPEEALTYFQKIIDLNPFNEPAILELGKTLIGLEKYEEALKLFNDAIENKPDFAEAYKERGNVKMHLNDKEGAMNDLKNSLELAPQAGEQINGNFTNIEDEMNARYKANNPFLG